VNAGLTYLNDSRLRRTVLGLVVICGALLAGLALLINRRDAASDLFEGCVVILVVEVIYSMSRVRAASSHLKADSDFTRFLRGSQAIGALFFWALAALLLVGGIVRLFQP
jgi:hypothetical protein